jgi:uncharacterized protein (TIGR02145 family)
MRIPKLGKGIVAGLILTTIYSCVPEEIILHGVIGGNVTDADIKQPLDHAIVTLKQSQTTLKIDTTDMTGAFQFKNLSPGDYEVMASKQLFETEEKIISVEEANITEISFSLNGTPYPEFSSTWVDFGFESLEGSIIISNAGRGELRYSLITNQDWITVEPNDGKITTGADTITVTINRTNLKETKYEEEIYFTYYISGEPVQENIDVLVNGIVDRDGNCYSIVTIGTQTWMQENLNTGVQITRSSTEQSDNQIVEKYCYGDIAANCETYGGLYTWGEMTDYSPADAGMIGTTQGVCPDGWHIPSHKEFRVLAEYLGGIEVPLLDGYDVAGGRMKSSSSLWDEPNLGDCDSGFEALPGGHYNDPNYLGEGIVTYFYTSDPGEFGLMNSHDWVGVSAKSFTYNSNRARSLRCIKDPE